MKFKLASRRLPLWKTIKWFFFGCPLRNGTRFKWITHIEYCEFL